MSFEIIAILKLIVFSSGAGPALVKPEGTSERESCTTRLPKVGGEVGEAKTREE
jgi:hypothetical protein